MAAQPESIIHPIMHRKTVVIEIRCEWNPVVTEIRCESPAHSIIHPNPVVIELGSELESAAHRDNIMPVHRKTVAIKFGSAVVLAGDPARQRRSQG